MEREETQIIQEVEEEKNEHANSQAKKQAPRAAFSDYEHKDRKTRVAELATVHHTHLTAMETALLSTINYEEMGFHLKYMLLLFNNIGRANCRLDFWWGGCPVQFEALALEPCHVHLFQFSTSSSPPPLPLLLAQLFTSTTATILCRQSKLKVCCPGPGPYFHYCKLIINRGGIENLTKEERR